MTTASVRDIQPRHREAVVKANIIYVVLSGSNDFTEVLSVKLDILR